MNQMMMTMMIMFALLWCTGSHLASAAHLRSPEDDVTTVHNGTAATLCGVPAIPPVVPGCEGLGIINGSKAEPHSWPWQASVQDDEGSNYCGGSLINKIWVVTAAHCEVSKLDSVVLGLDNLVKDKDVQNMKIVKVFNHPDYDDRTNDNDIALIKLQRPAEMNKLVSPVCVAETSDVYNAGTKCVVTGWGLTRKDPSCSPRKLRQVCVPLITVTKCKSFLEAVSPITRQMICAGAAGGDTCQGDSGGPLVCEKNGAWTLVGVTSWGLAGCPTDKPGVYARVSALRAWMDKTMANN